MSKFENGNTIEILSGPHLGDQGEIVKQDAGWYHVEMEDGETIKARASNMKLIAAEPDDTEGEDGDAESLLMDAIEDAEEAALTAAQQMAEALRRARVRYQKTRRPNGAQSADCGDDLAKELREVEPADAMTLADKVMGDPIGTHEAKYLNLNNGQKRMNSGNRIRAAYKKAIEAGDVEEITRICDIVGIELPEHLQVEEQDAA